jgi:porin
MGEGNYRLLLDTTSDDFSNVDGSDKERLSALSLSFDQQFGEILGAWIRFGWQDDKAAIDYKGTYSGGLNISGSLWGRGQDNIGLGYAHLRGGNLDVNNTDVFEIYGRFALNDIFAITGDIQYMKDSYKDGDNDSSAWIFGLRATAEF